MRNSKEGKTMTNPDSKFLITPEAATYVQEERGVPCKPKTLQKLRTIGGGPAYQKFGNRVLYTKAALDEWVDDKLSPPRRSSAA